MKLVVVTGSFPSTSQTFVTDEVRAAVEAGVDIEVLAAESSDRSPDPRLRSHVWVKNWRRCPVVPFSAAAFRSAMTTAANATKYGRVLGLRRRVYFSELLSNPAVASADLIHAHWTSWAEEVAMPLAQCLRIPFTCTAHDSFLASVPTETLINLQRQARVIVAVSSWTRDHWAERTGSTRGIVVVPNGVHIPVTGRDHQQPNTPPVIVNVARCTEVKRQADLLSALAVLKQRGIQFRCEIVGDGPEKARLHALRDTLGLQDCCELKGALPHEATLSVVARSDIFALTSSAESFGVVTAEAMAAGLPTVVTNVGGSVDLVEDGVTGYLVAVGDVAMLARRLESLLLDQPLRAGMGLRGRVKAIERFSFDAHIAKMIELWREAASPNP